ncbi:MAG: hypothetical protein HYY96_01540 [Candidatus Tectomicrobia bacterium]|nr:hypothetical protein [Candidatus Tectomicrobia bacterium]
MLDAILFEQAGVPSAAIVTDAFVRTGAAIAAAWGMPDYGFAVTHHPIVIQSTAELARWATEVVPQVRAILSGEAASGGREGNRRE